MIRGYPYYAAERTSWLVGCPNDNFMITRNDPNTIGYQAYPETNLVSDPAKLGGLWFSKKRRHVQRHKKTKRTKKSRSIKSRSIKSRSKKTRKQYKRRQSRKQLSFGRPRLVTPNSIATTDGFVFS
jgi:hypothetical protein